MKKRFILRILGLLIDLTLMTSLILAACSKAATPIPTRAATLTPIRAATPTPTRAATPTPTRAARLTPTQELSVTVTAPSPVASEPVDLSQVLDRWDAQRVALEDLDEFAQKYLGDGEKSSSPISYTLASQAFMIGGDMRASIKALNKAVDIDPQADVPHFLLADVIYRLAFFDMVDRGLCSIELTPIQEIPEASLHHGRLRIEIWELVYPGRPTFYEDLLASWEMDELMQHRIRMYLLWLDRSMMVESAEVEAALQDLGGPPGMLPVPECKPDDKSKHFLRMAYEEISLARQGKPLETPGLMIVDKDGMADLAVGIQVLLDVDLSQVLDRWDDQRVVNKDLEDEIAREYLKEAERSSSIVLYALGGNGLMIEGDMRAAIEALNEAVAIDPQADVPHFLLADVIYRLAFFDMVDRGLCDIELTPIQEIPEAPLHHGHLQIEIFELTNSGRPAVYQELLTSQGIDKLAQIKTQFYLLGLVQERLPSVDLDKMLEDLGGPPEMLPVPKCESDDRSRHLLKMAYEEITLAEQGSPLETPGVVVVYKDRMDNLTVRIQVLLGDEVVPITQPVSVPTLEPGVLTSDPWGDVIRGISTHVDATQKDKTDERYRDDYEALQKKQQDACATGNLMQCYTVGYEFLVLAQLGYFDAYADAIDTFNLVLNENPEFGRAHYGLGEVYYAISITDLTVRGQMQTAESGLPIPVLDEQGADLFQRALDELELAFTLDLELANNSDARSFVEMIKAKLVSYWIQRGYEMEASKDPAAAIDCYDKALRLDPQSYVANFNKGNALVALSQFQEAIQAYDKALTVETSAEAIHNREIVRLLANGIQWPDGPRALEFLQGDLDSPDRVTQLGAALLLSMECMEENQTACDIFWGAVQQDPSIFDDLEELAEPNH